MSKKKKKERPTCAACGYKHTTPAGVNKYKCSKCGQVITLASEVVHDDSVFFVRGRGGG